MTGTVQYNNTVLPSTVAVRFCTELGATIVVGDVGWVGVGIVGDELLPVTFVMTVETTEPSALIATRSKSYDVPGCRPEITTERLPIGEP